MDTPLRPKLRPVDSFPMRQPDGGVEFVLRDPDGFSSPIMLPYAGAMVASLMDGQRTIEEIQADYQARFGEALEVEDLQYVLEQLDQRGYLDNDRFRALWKQELTIYLNSDKRPAAFAGQAYPSDPVELRQFLDGLFTQPKGPGLPDASATATDRLIGVLCPTVDLRRAGLSLAASYKRLIEQSGAETFVILGTAHRSMRNRYALTKKNFETPLGTIDVDRDLILRLNNHVRGSGVGDELQLFGDELAHRHEHSIEFQSLMLQHLLGSRRSFKIAPVLVDSFQDLVADGTEPIQNASVNAFIQALRSTISSAGRSVAVICSADLAHVGQRYGDKSLLDEPHLRRQAESDRSLLETAASGDASGVFAHVAGRANQDRVWGLGPLYTMLKTIEPARGDLLRHDQAVELDFTGCVSFGSIAYYKPD
jgi:MEMO1 family protein